MERYLGLTPLPFPAPRSQRNHTRPFYRYQPLKTVPINYHYHWKWNAHFIFALLNFVRSEYAPQEYQHTPLQKNGNVFGHAFAGANKHSPEYFEITDERGIAPSRKQRTLTSR
jgi:hypothetical protein